METTLNPVPTSTRSRIREMLLYLAWVQALVATLGSLFFSEVLAFVPCTLCWYQRILMYPLPIVLAVGILLRDTRLRYYVLPISLSGLAVALYHNLLYYGVIAENTFGTCTQGASCTVRWFEWLGFISIPQLSLLAFTIITACMLGYKPGEQNDTDQQPTPYLSEQDFNES